MFHWLSHVLAHKSTHIHTNNKYIYFLCKRELLRMAVTSQLYSTLKFTFWPLRSSGQSSEVDSTGIMINPILQMRKVRLGGVNTGLCFSVGSAELGWDSCLAQCCFTANFLVQTKMCRDSGSTLWSRVSVCLEQTRSRTVNGHLNAMPRNGASVENGNPARSLIYVSAPTTKGPSLFLFCPALRYQWPLKGHPLLSTN